MYNYIGLTWKSFDRLVKSKSGYIPEKVRDCANP